MNDRQTRRLALMATVPVLSGYLVLGFGFGLILRAAGFGVDMAFVMSLAVYAGSMQYLAVGLLAGGASWVTVALTTLMVNARHLFYGLSMLDAYREVGALKPYLIFGLTDETYSLVCHLPPQLPPHQHKRYCFWVTLADHVYWVSGSVAGALAGSLMGVNTQGVEFALTALFLTVFVDQWRSQKTHGPAVVGVGVSLVCLLIFGPDSFLLPAMAGIALLLCCQKEVPRG